MSRRPASVPVGAPVVRGVNRSPGDGITRLFQVSHEQPTQQTEACHLPSLHLKLGQMVDLTDLGSLKESHTGLSYESIDIDSLDSLEWSTDSEMSFAAACLLGGDVMVVETDAGLMEIRDVAEIGRKKKKKRRGKAKKGSLTREMRRKDNVKKKKKKGFDKENSQNSRRRDGRRNQRKAIKEKESKTSDSGGGGGSSEKTDKAIENLRREAKANKAEARQAVSDAKKQKAEARKAKSLADNFREQVDNQKKQIKELERNLDLLRERGENATAAAASCSVDAKEALAKARELGVEVDVYKANALASEQNLDRKETMLANAKRELAALHAAGRASSEELSTAKMSLDQAQREYYAAKEKINAAEAALTKMSNMIDIAESKLYEANYKVSELEQNVEARTQRETGEDARIANALSLFEAARGQDAERREEALEKLESLMKSLIEPLIKPDP